MVRPHAEFNALNKNKILKELKYVCNFRTMQSFWYYASLYKYNNKKKKKVYYSIFKIPDERTFKKQKKVLKKNHIKLNKIKLR